MLQAKPLKTPKITVYMPNFNYGKYIQKSIQSILDQSVDDWELIIIDDGSTDDSMKQLEKFKDHPKIAVIAQENRGLNVTNNVAIRLSRGKYIVRLDADDFVDENFLLVLSNILDRNPDIGLVYPDWHFINEDGEILETYRRKKVGEEVEVLDIPAHGACTMFRKEILLRVGAYNESYTCQDGYDIWLKFLSESRPYNVNIPLFYYRQHGTSLTRNQKKILDTRMAIKRGFVEQKGGLKLSILGVIPITNKGMYKQSRPFVMINERPLMWYTLNEALHSRSLQGVVVSTDDDEVIDYVQKNFPSFFIHRRENSKSADSNTDKTVGHILSYLQSSQDKKFDAVCLMYISTPLRKAEHIDHAADTMDIFQTDSVISVQEELMPCYNHDKFGLTPVNAIDSKKPRLERNAIFKENGCVFLHKISNLHQYNTLVGRSIGHINMLPEESVKINSDFELWLVDTILRKNNSSFNLINLNNAPESNLWI